MDKQTIEIDGYNGSREISLDARFLKEHKVFLYDEINQESAGMLVQQLMWLENQEDDTPIKLYINSPGGEITSGLLIYDVLQAMTKEVDIYCTGIAASMAALILASGKPGHRHILPHSQTMIREPLIQGGIGGSATSVQHLSNSIMETKKMVNKILAKHVGKKLKEIDKATSYDNYMDAKQSVEFGLCDDVTDQIF